MCGTRAPSPIERSAGHAHGDGGPHATVSAKESRGGTPATDEDSATHIRWRVQRPVARDLFGAHAAVGVTRSLETCSSGNNDTAEGARARDDHRLAADGNDATRARDALVEELILKLAQSEAH